MKREKKKLLILMMRKSRSTVVFRLRESRINGNCYQAERCLFANQLYSSFLSDDKVSIRRKSTSALTGPAPRLQTNNLQPLKCACRGGHVC